MRQTSWKGECADTQLWMAIELLLNDAPPESPADHLVQLQDIAFALHIITTELNAKISVAMGCNEEAIRIVGFLSEQVYRLSVGIERLLHVRDVERLEPYRDQIASSVHASRSVGVLLVEFLVSR